MENKLTISTLRSLLDYNASMFSSGEVQLKKSLPDWISKSASIQLKQVLLKYLDLVQEHVQKMDKFFNDENFASLSSTNFVMHALIEETNEKLNYCTENVVLDACLLACVQAINHFKISAYGTAAAFAEDMGLEQSAALFYGLEINEKNIDDRLSQLAKYEINRKANAPINLPE